MDIIVGTAGHIDHGKTSLVRTLTGVDADRLPEEKKRGITIDLGFAELDLDGTRIGFVDVPGHERFVKNMLAGAGGIDLVLLVVAADEGVMPQTREHFEICRLLGTRGGVIALTKSDLADEDLIELVELDVSELVAGSFLESASVVSFSSKTGEGKEDLIAALTNASKRIPEREQLYIPRLPVDRSFSVKGFGAVVTGTLLSGKISPGEELEVLPEGRKSRVRGLQVHDRDVGAAFAGQRTAVNLGGLDQEQVRRGMMMAEPGVLGPSQIIDADFEVLEDSPKPLRTRQRVRVHLGTAEALARLDVLNEERRIEPGARGFAQLRFEGPVVSIPGDRFIIRQYSPQITIAGGRVLNSHASKHKRKEYAEVVSGLEDRLNALGDPAAMLRCLVSESKKRGVSKADLRTATGFDRAVADHALENVISEGAARKAGEVLIASATFEGLKKEISSHMERFHSAEPLAPGAPRESVRDGAGHGFQTAVVDSALKELEAEGVIAIEADVIRLASHSRELTEEAEKVLERLRSVYESAGLEVPTMDEALAHAAEGTRLGRQDARKILQILIDSSELVKVTGEFCFSKEAIGSLTGKLKEFADASESGRFISVPEFKDLAGVSRKYAIPLLEHFDANGVTRRAGDKRLIL